MTTTQRTRYAELGYRKEGAALWRIVALEGDASVGPYYRTKAELLADLSRYASGYGATEGSPSRQAVKDTLRGMEEQ